MPQLIADDFKELVRTRTDIVALISESVSLQPQRGGREYVGLCPFHDDHNPSMRVYPDRQSFRCWVCNEGGDCFAFVMKRERFGFREALEMLAERAHVELPKAYRASSGSSGADKNRMYEVLRWAEGEFHTCLLQSPAAERARRYFRERGIAGESIVKFGLGYHPDSDAWLLERSRGRYSHADLVGTGLLRENTRGAGYYSSFKDRVLFPIRDAQRRAVAFGGRVLPDGNSFGGKYTNSAETVLFTKSRFLYGMDQARETIAKGGEVAVVEGYTDCIMAHQHGLTNFVGTLGTALNENHVLALKRFARKVVMVYDGDEAGRIATEKSLPKILAHEIDLRVLTLPGGADPDEFLLAHGGEALRNLLTAAVEAWDQKLRLVLERHGLGSIDARHRVLDEMLQILAEVPRPAEGLAGKWQEREIVILGQLAHRLKVPEQQVRARLAEVRTLIQQKQGVRQSASPADPVPPADDTAPAAVVTSDRMSGDERAQWWLLATIFSSAEQAEPLRHEIGPEELTHILLRRLYETCLQIWNEGGVPSYDRVTTRLEDQELKKLAASIDEHARQVGVTAEVQAHWQQYFRRRRAASAVGSVTGGPHGFRSPAGEKLDAKARLRLAAERRRIARSETNQS